MHIENNDIFVAVSPFGLQQRQKWRIPNLIPFERWQMFLHQDKIGKESLTEASLHPL